MTDTVLENGSIQPRLATEDDLELLMAWRSHPDVYRYLYLQEGPLVWDERFRFWKTRQDRVDWIIHLDDGTRRRKAA